MTAVNFDHALRMLVERRPFEVFTVELNDGARFEIDFPNAIVFREGVAVFVAPGGIPVLFDHDSVNKVIGVPANTSI